MGSRKLDDRVVGLGVPADQFVRFRDADNFLHARHFFERPGFDLTLVAGDADGGALRAGHGVGAVSESFDLLANGADLVFGGLRFHDDEHGKTPTTKSVSLPRGEGNSSGVGKHLEKWADKKYPANMGCRRAHR